MAGAFLTFILQYTSFRFSEARSRKVAASKPRDDHAESMNGDGSDKSSQTQTQVQAIGHLPNLDDPLSVLILEMGIIFHSASMSNRICSILLRVGLHSLSV